MKKQSVQIKEQVANVLSLPQDLVLGKPLISCIGRNEIYIENYQSILKYNSDELIVSTKTGSIHFKGRNIKVDYYTYSEMKIVGIVDELRFV